MGGLPPPGFFLRFVSPHENKVVHSVTLCGDSPGQVSCHSVSKGDPQPQDAEFDNEITRLLHAIKAGDENAADTLMRIVYGQLKKMAHRRAGGNVDPTTLVHEAYLKLVSPTAGFWENRRHFYWAAARAMRDVIVERARANAAIKRGGGHQQVEFEEPPNRPSDVKADELLALDEALKKLELKYPLAARIVTLRFYGGFTREEIASETNLSEAAVWREWKFAKAWLYRNIEGSSPPIDTQT